MRASMLIATVAAACACRAAPGENLIANGGFETTRIVRNVERGFVRSLLDRGWDLGDPLKPEMVVGWDHYAGPAKVRVVRGKAGAEVQEGERALHVITSGHGCRFLGSTRGKPNVLYRFSFWAKGKGAMRIATYEWGAKPPPVHCRELARFDITPEWKAHTGTYETFSPLARSFTFVLIVSKDSDVVVDDVRLWEPPSAPSEAAPEGDVKVAAVRRTTQPPRIDAKLDDACWKAADWTGGFLDYRDQTMLAALPTEFALLHDGQWLYLAVRNADPEAALRDIRQFPHDKWPSGPVNEIFFDPGATRTDYFQFGTNAAGTRYESRKMDPSWNGEWRTAGTVGGDGWVVEAAFRLTSLAAASPRPGDRWGFSLCRDAKGGAYSTWASVGGYFHSPGRFGTIVFGDYGEWYTQGFLAECRRLSAALRSEVASLPRHDKAIADALRGADASAERVRREVAAVLPIKDHAAFQRTYRQCEAVLSRYRDLATRLTWTRAILHAERER